MPNAIEQKRIVIFLPQLWAQTISLQEIYFTFNGITSNYSNKGKYIFSTKKKKTQQNPNPTNQTVAVSLVHKHCGV